MLKKAMRDFLRLESARGMAVIAASVRETGES
jgi:hypothetical protein